MILPSVVPVRLLTAALLALVLSLTLADSADARSGSVAVQLHAGEAVPLNELVRVGFGLPLAEGVEDPSQIRVLDDLGSEIPAAVVPLVRWADVRSGVVQRSWRAVRIQVERRFDSRKTQVVRVEWNRGARQRSLAPTAARDGWVRVDDDEYPAAAGVLEPAVYATLPASYLSTGLLFAPTLPFVAAGREKDFRIIDDAQPQFLRTAINDVGPGILPGEKVRVLTDTEPWLYDRATAFYRTYARSGEVSHLKAAQRAAQFYVARLDASGFFDLKRERDPKYSYAESAFATLMLIGDDAMLPKIETAVRGGEQVRVAYRKPDQFWTERNVAYRVLNLVVAFEATGKPQYAKQARDDVGILLEHLRNPPAFIPVRLRQEGCFVHTAESHGEGNADQFVCSPWMSVLLVGALQRYDRRGEDRAIGEAVMNLAQFTLKVGSRIEERWIDGSRPLRPARIPYYLVTSDRVHEGDPWSDKEHALDVAKLTALASLYARRSGDPRADAFHVGTLEFISAGRVNLESWIRLDGPRAGKPAYRLAPSRKFAWWFNAYHDVEYLLGAL